MIDVRRTRHFAIAAATTLAILVGAAGVLVKRQFARDNGVRLELDQATSTNAQDAKPASSFDSDGLVFERTLVKRAPLSATMVTETQPADRSVPATTTTSLIFRDAKGRTRRDRMPMQSTNADQQPQFTTINDPVDGFTYALEHGTRLFRRTVFQSMPEDSSDLKTTKKTGLPEPKQASSSQMLPMPSAWGNGQSLKRGVASSFSETKTEQLGEQEIEGVMAEGTRITVSLPAGAVGNSEPIAIITERWYSPELKTVILIKRSDPRYGETIYRLTKLKRDEPAANLFVVPMGYKISHEAAKELFSPD